MNRIGIAFLFLAVGVGLVFLPGLIAPNGCRETCPEWFSLSLLSFAVLTPLTWLGAGVWLGRSTVKRSVLARMTMALLALSLVLVCGLAYLGVHYQQTSSYGSISG